MDPFAARIPQPKAARKMFDLLKYLAPTSESRIRTDRFGAAF